MRQMNTGRTALAFLAIGSFVLLAGCGSEESEKNEKGKPAEHAAEAPAGGSTTGAVGAGAGNGFGTGTGAGRTSFNAGVNASGGTAGESEHKAASTAGSGESHPTTKSAHESK